MFHPFNQHSCECWDHHINERDLRPSHHGKTWKIQELSTGPTSCAFRTAGFQNRRSARCPLPRSSKTSPLARQPRLPHLLRILRICLCRFISFPYHGTTFFPTHISAAHHSIIDPFAVQKIERHLRRFFRLVLVWMDDATVWRRIPRYRFVCQSFSQ